MEENYNLSYSELQGLLARARECEEHETERRTDDRWRENWTDRDVNEQRRTDITGTQVQLKVLN